MSASRTLPGVSCTECNDTHFVPAREAVEGRFVTGVRPCPKCNVRLILTDWPAERLGEIHQVYDRALRSGRAPNGVELHPDDREFLRAMADAWGEDHIVPARTLAERMPRLQQLTSYENRRRALAASAERLTMDYGFVARGLIIGAYKQYEKTCEETGMKLKLHGYFWVMTHDELRRAYRHYWRETCARLRRLAAVLPKQARAIERELAGQYQLAYGSSPYDPSAEAPRARRTG